MEEARELCTQAELVRKWTSAFLRSDWPAASNSAAPKKPSSVIPHPRLILISAPRRPICISPPCGEQRHALHVGRPSALPYTIRGLHADGLSGNDADVVIPLGLDQDSHVPFV